MRPLELAVVGVGTACMGRDDVVLLVVPVEAVATVVNHHLVVTLTARPAIELVKKGTASAPHEVDGITGATISSRTVIEIINERMVSMGPMIQAFRAEPREAPAADELEADAGAMDTAVGATRCC